VKREGGREKFEVESLKFEMKLDLPGLTTIADGNGRMGRLGQTLIGSPWNSLFGHIPVESLVHEHQIGYYQVLQDSTDATDTAPFISFVLAMIFDAVSSVPPQATPNVHQSLAVLRGEMSRARLQYTVGLKDLKFL
jgi:hypothetical protein